MRSFLARYWKAVVTFMGAGGGTTLVQVLYVYFPPPGTPPADPSIVRMAIYSLIVGLGSALWTAISAANAPNADTLVKQMRADPAGAGAEVKEAAARGPAS